MVVSNRYASSLFELSQSENIVEEINSNIALVKKTLENKELFDVLCAPSINDYDKMEIIKKIFQNNVNQYVINFIGILIEKKRINLFFSIYDEFVKIYNTEMNIETATIITAVSLDESEQNALLEKLSKENNKNIKADFKVDKTILGGVKVLFENRLIDGSIKTKLENLNKQM